MTWNDLIKALQSQPPEFLDKEVTISVPYPDDTHGSSSDVQFVMDELSLNIGRLDVKDGLYLE